MRRWLFLLAILLGLLALAACAAEKQTTPAPTGAALATPAAWEQEWERVLAAAKREGKVAVIGPPGADVRRALTEPFQRKYGITVEYLPARGGEIASRLQAERDAGQYLWDLHIGSPTYVFTLFGPMKALEPLEPALILPEVKDGQNWRGGKLPMVDKDGFSLAMSKYVTEAFYYNTNLIKAGEIKSYRDLLDPKWKGKIMALDPTILGSGDAKFAFFYLHKDLGPEFIRALARQEILITRDYNQIAEWLATGKYAISIGGDKNVIAPMTKAGAPLTSYDSKQMKEGGSIHVGLTGLMPFNRAPHPNAAKVYINWLLTKEAQTEYSRATGLPSSRADVPTDHVDPFYLPVEGYIPLDGEDGTKLRTERLQPFLKEVLAQ